MKFGNSRHTRPSKQLGGNYSTGAGYRQVGDVIEILDSDEDITNIDDEVAEDYVRNVVSGQGYEADVEVDEEDVRLEGVVDKMIGEMGLKIEGVGGGGGRMGVVEEVKRDPKLEGHVERVMREANERFERRGGRVGFVEVDEEVIGLGGSLGVIDVDNWDSSGIGMADKGLDEMVKNGTTYVKKLGKAGRVRLFSVVEDIIQFSHEVGGRSCQELDFVKVTHMMKQLISVITKLGNFEIRMTRKEQPKRFIVSSTMQSKPIDYYEAQKILKEMLHDYHDIRRLVVYPGSKKGKTHMATAQRHSSKDKEIEVALVERSWPVVPQTRLTLDMVWKGIAARDNGSDKKSKKSKKKAGKDGVLVHEPISEDNKGHALMRKMGWKQGEGLGKGNQGRTEPLAIQLRSGRQGLGRK